MTSYVTPKKNTAYKFYVSLVDQSNTNLTKANPTIAAGDFKVSTDGGAFANLTTLPSANPASGRAVMIDLSTSEMNGDNIVVQCVDAAGAEWCDLIVNIQTTARQIDDLAFPATSGRSMVVDASGLVDANMVKAGPTGSGTAQTAKDIGGALPAAAAGAINGLPILGANAASLSLTGLTTNILGNLVGTVSTLTTYTGNTPQTGDAYARLGAPAGASTAVDIAAVKTDTSNIYSRIGAPVGASISADIAGVPTTVWATVIAGSTTAIQAMRGFIAAMMGKASGLDLNAPKYRNIADSKDVISATTDANGNRTAVTLDLT